MKTISKWNTSRACINAHDAIVSIPVYPSTVYQYACIPEGYQLIETETEYVGVLNEQTGESHDLVWQPFTAGMRIQIIQDLRFDEHEGVLYPTRLI